MYKLATNPNRVLVALALFAGLASVIYLPGQYPEKIVEIPLLALAGGEMGLALFCSLLFFENAAPSQILKLAASMFGFEMLIGTIGNWTGQLTQMLPDSFVLVSWVQLIIMNTAGILCTLCLYQMRSPEESQKLRARLATPVTVQPSASRPAGSGPTTLGTVDPVPPEDFTPTAEATAEPEPKRAQSVKEILEGLDISRIMRLEKSIHPPEPPTMESLFKEESQAAEASASKSATEAGAESRPADTADGPDVYHMPGSTEKSLDSLDFSPLKLITDKKSTEPATTDLDSGDTASIEGDLSPAKSVDSTAGAGRGAIPLAPITVDDEPIPLSAAPAAPADEPIALPGATAPEGEEEEKEETIPLSADPAAEEEEIIPLAAAPASVDDEAVPLSDTLILPGRDAGKTAAVEEDLSDEIIPLAADPETETETLPPKPIGPSLQELLKSEPMTGPLEALDDEPSTAEPTLDLVAPEGASKEAEIEAEENAFDDEVVEEELDEAFKKLVPREALRNVSSETLAQLRETKDAEKRAQSAEEDAPIHVKSKAGNDIADLIKSLAEQEQGIEEPEPEPEPEPEAEAEAEKTLESPPEPKSRPEPQSPPPRAAEPKEVKDFGRLSAKASAKTAEDLDTSGSMKTIGKMLIDTQAVENIIKQGEKRAGGMTTAKIVSAKRGEAIHSLLSYIDHFPGVTGSLIVGNDGLVICSTVDPSLDKDLIGAMSLAIHGNSDIAADKLTLGPVREIVLQAKNRLTVLRKLDDGILVVLSDSPQAGRVDGLLKLLSSLMRGKTDGEEPAASDAQQESSVPPAQAAPEPKEATTPSPAPAKPSPAESATESSSESQPQRTAVAADLVRDLIASLSVQPPAQADDAPAPQAASEPEVEESEAEATLLPDEPVAERPGFPVEDLTESTPQSTFAQSAPPVDSAPAAVPPPEKADKAHEEPTATKAAPEPDPVAAKPEPSEAQQEKKVDQEKPTQAAPAKAVKEFGRLSSQSSAVPVQEGESGTMSIGKMLLDVQAVSNIIKTAEKRTSGLTTARVISAARGEGIRSLLSKVDNYSGVAGSLIVGHDGLVIASTLSADMDKDTLSAMATSIHSHTNITTKKLDLGTLHQAVLLTPDKITVLTNVEVGVLAVFFESTELNKLDGLLQAIEETVQS